MQNIKLNADTHQIIIIIDSDNERGDWLMYRDFFLLFLCNFFLFSLKYETKTRGVSCQLFYVNKILKNKETIMFYFIFCIDSVYLKDILTITLQIYLFFILLYFMFVLFQVCMICLYVWCEYKNKNKMLRWIQKKYTWTFLFSIKHWNYFVGFTKKKSFVNHVY